MPFCYFMHVLKTYSCGDIFKADPALERIFTWYNNTDIFIFGSLSFLTSLKFWKKNHNLYVPVLMKFASILYFCRALHDGIIMADDKLYETVKYLINVYKIYVYRKCQMNVFGKKNHIQINSDIY